MDRISTAPEIRIIPETPGPLLGGLERKEENALEDGEKKVRKEVHAIAVQALRFGALVIGVIVLVRVWHIISPTDLRWLSELDTQSIDKMLFSSAFGGLVLGYLKETMRQPTQKK